jgi:uncharacterized protein (TIGR03032 family)
MTALPPFSLSYTPSLPELLTALDVSLALTTHQAGKLVLVSPAGADRLVQLPRNFTKALALGVDGDRMALATRSEVVVLRNAPSLGASYPKQPRTYDGFYAPRVTHHTGPLDIHGLAWGHQDGREALWAVATVFSCLATLDASASLVPRWHPPFISRLEPDDRCHLNGMAMDGGAPAFVTALGQGDAARSWRAGLPRGGVLVHVPTREVLLTDLPMPHSPRLYDGRLYALFSATGEVVRIDPERRTFDVIRRLDGFVRGLAFAGDYLFVGLSRLRPTASAFKELEMSHKANQAGVVVLHLGTGAIVGTLEYKSSVDEIFDLAVLPGLRRPGVLGTHDETHQSAVVTPEKTYWAAPEE